MTILTLACQRIEFPTVSDSRGNLTVAECFSSIPFQIARVYWIWDIPEEAKRGGHAHREQHEVIVAVPGAFTLNLRDAYGREQSFRLDNPKSGILIPPTHWRDISHYEPGSTSLVFSSGIYEPDEYIRDPGEFFVDASNSIKS